MYTQFYGLREKPFSLSPDPRFLFLSEAHREALAHLLYGIEQGEGFIAITGEVGTGKTTLCRTLLRRIEPGSEIAFIFNPQLSGLELLQAIGAEFGLQTADRSRRELTEQLNRFLLQKRREGRRVLLVIDEAQALEPDALEQVRLLSNLETDTEKLLQIVLLGQPELDATLESPGLRQLRQRISVRWRLGGLSAAETRDYVRHRLRIAAGTRRDLFSEAALREIHRRSGGTPRLINLLCDRALLAGYAAGATSIGLGLVVETDREVRARVASARGRTGARERVAQVALPALAVLVAAALGFAIARNSAPPAALPAAAPGAEAGPPPVSAAPPDGAFRPRSQFATRLAATAPAATTASALDALLATWRLPPLHAPLLSQEQALSTLRADGLTVLALHGALLDDVIAADRPALVVLRALDGTLRMPALLGVTEEGALLAGLAPAPARVPLESLRETWTGEVWIPWRDAGEVPLQLASDTSATDIATLQRALSALGRYHGPTDGELDAATRSALAEAAGPEFDGVSLPPLLRLRLAGALASPPPPTLLGQADAGSTS